VFIQCPTNKSTIPCDIVVEGNFYTTNGTVLRTFIEGTDLSYQNQSTSCNLNIHVGGSVTIADNSAVMVCNAEFHFTVLSDNSWILLGAFAEYYR
jgi:hypothetical protein